MTLLAALAAVALAGSEAPTPSAPPPGEKPVEAYTQSNANAGVAPVSGTATFAAFHGRAGLDRITTTLVKRVRTDPRTQEIFAAADTVRLQRTLAEQFCYILNGGCDYTGRDMQSSHRDQGLQFSDFNALVENLQIAMDEERVPFRAQNVLLAKLAPMQRAVVVRRSPAVLKTWRRKLAALRTGG